MRKQQKILDGGNHTLKNNLSKVVLNNKRNKKNIETVPTEQTKTSGLKIAGILFK